MKQLELYPNRNKYRLWDENDEQWFITLKDVCDYLRETNHRYVRTKTLTHTDQRLLTKMGVRVYALN